LVYDYNVEKFVVVSTVKCSYVVCLQLVIS